MTHLISNTPFYSDYLGPKALNYSDDPVRFGRLVRTSIQRLCDWVDAGVQQLAARLARSIKAVVTGF